MDLLELQIYGFTLLEIAGGLGILLTVVLVYKFWPRKHRNQHTEFANCTSCGWSGQVGKYARTCPGCNAKL